MSGTRATGSEATTPKAAKHSHRTRGRDEEKSAHRFADRRRVLPIQTSCVGARRLGDAFVAVVFLVAVVL